MASLKKYNLVFGLTLGLLMGVVILNYIINPFDIFDISPIENINLYKPEATKRERLSKAYQLSRDKPDALILGSSRALRINPDHLFFNKYHAFNAAIASSSTYENLAYLRHANSANRVRLVVLGLDIFSGGTGTQPGFSNERLLGKTDFLGRWRRFQFQTHDRVSSLLSLDALRASIKTLRMQNVHKASSTAALRNRIQKHGGQRQLFINAERVYFEDVPFLPVRPSALHRINFLTPEYFNELGSMIDYCYQNNIDLQIYISPSHARLLEVWHQLGLGHLIDEWKTSLAILMEERARYHGKMPYRVIDFSGYNRLTTETVPKHGDSLSVMKWYEESTHFSTATASMILDELLMRKLSNCTSKKCTGIPVTAGYIKAHIERQQRKRIEWRKISKTDLQDIRQLWVHAQARHSPAITTH